jgi:Flp pilus assembly protein TadG
MAALRSRLRLARLKDDRGVELIEFAIVFPIFMVIVAAMLDLGFLFQRYEVVTNAAREGARLGTLQSQGYTVGDVQQRVGNYLTASGLNSASATTTVTYATETLPSGLTIPTVKVLVQYPSSFVLMAPFAGMIGGSAPGTITLKAASVMRVEAGGS